MKRRKVNERIWIHRIVRGLHDVNWGAFYTSLFLYLGELGLSKQLIGILIGLSFLGRGVLYFYRPRLRKWLGNRTLLFCEHIVTAGCAIVLLLMLARWAVLPATVIMMITLGHKLQFLNSLEGISVFELAIERNHEEGVSSSILWFNCVSVGIFGAAIMIGAAKGLAELGHFENVFRTIAVLEWFMLVLVFTMLPSEPENSRDVAREKDEEQSLYNKPALLPYIYWAFTLQAVGEGIVFFPWRLQHLSMVLQNRAHAVIVLAVLSLGYQLSPIVSLLLTSIFNRPIQSAVALEAMSALIYIGVGSSPSPERTKQLLGVSLILTSRFLFVPVLVSDAVPESQSEQLLTNISFYRFIGLCVGSIVMGVLAQHNLYSHSYYASALLLLLCCVILTNKCASLRMRSA